MKVFQLSSTQVASGALIYTYLAGTTTNKTTYSDQGLTTPNANPVVADANGEANVWLSDDTLYKIVITDSLGVPISSDDNIGQIVNSTVTQGSYNLIDNGSFEVDVDTDGVPDDWTLSINTGSTIAIDSTTQSHGINSLKFVGSGGGAGTATSTFFAVQASKSMGVRFTLSASLATVTQTVKVLWYTSAKTAASVASTTVYNVTTTAPTSFTEQILAATPGSDVRYGKIEISGSSSPGTTYYDDIIVTSSDAQVITNATITLTQSTTPTPTAEGVIEWDTDGNNLAVGDGATTQTFSPDSKAGRIVQIINTQVSAVATGTTALPEDNTIPQNTEGDEYMTLAITPTTTGNMLLIEVVSYLSSNNTLDAYINIALFQDTTAGALSAGWGSRDPTLTSPAIVVLRHYMVAGTTSSTTFKVRAGTSNSGTTTFNGRGATASFGGVLSSSITITEIQV